MPEPTQKQVDSDLANSMDLFQRADVGKAHKLDPLKPESVLLVLDGSQQDPAVISLGRQLRENCGCRLAHLFIPPDGQTAVSADIKQQLKAAQSAAVVEGEVPEDEVASGRILAAVETYGPSLLVAPCPFGRNFESVEGDSTGTVVDVLTSRSPVPFIAIRRPVSADDNPTQHLRLVFTGANPAAETAARYALGITKTGGLIDMLLLVEESFYDNFREALHAIDPEKNVGYEDLEHALARTYGQLHASLQHSTEQQGLQYELLVRNEEDNDPVTPGDPQTHPALIVLGLQRNDHDSQGEVHDYVRRSPHPVLVVPIR